MEQATPPAHNPQLNRAYRIVANLRRLDEAAQRIRAEAYALAEELEQLARAEVTGEAVTPSGGEPLAAAGS